MKLPFPSTYSRICVPRLSYWRKNISRSGPGYMGNTEKPYQAGHQPTITHHHKRTMGRLPSPTRSTNWSEHRAKMESVTLMIRAIDKTMYCERDPMKTSRTTWWPFQPGLNQQITAPDDDPAASAPGPFPMAHHVLTLPHWHHLWKRPRAGRIWVSAHRAPLNGSFSMETSLEV